jgi:hypothetical protein
MYLRNYTVSDAKGKTLPSQPPWEHQISDFLTHLISHYQTHPSRYSIISVYITCIFYCLIYPNRIIQHGSRHEFAIVASPLVQVWIPHTWTVHSTEQYYRLPGRICTLVMLTALLSSLFYPPYGNYLHASRAEWDNIHTDTHKQTKRYADTRTSCCNEEAQEELPHINFHGIWQGQVLKHKIPFIFLSSWSWKPRCGATPLGISTGFRILSCHWVCTCWNCKEIYLYLTIWAHTFGHFHEDYSFIHSPEFRLFNLYFPVSPAVDIGNPYPAVCNPPLAGTVTVNSFVSV